MKPTRTHVKSFVFAWTVVLALLLLTGAMFLIARSNHDRSEDAQRGVRINRCETLALTRANQRILIQNVINTGMIFRDNSKSTVIRAFFKNDVPRHRDLLRKSPPIDC